MVSDVFIATLLILPGFISFTIIQELSAHFSQVHGHKYYLYSLFLSTVVFVIYSILCGIESVDEFDTIIVNYKTIFSLYAISLFLGFLFGFLDLFVRKKLNILEQSVWLTTLDRLNKECGKYVTIFTSDDSEFSGCVRMYSGFDDNQNEILIGDPKQIIRNENMEVIFEVDWGNEILFTGDAIKRIVLYESTMLDS